MERIRAGRIGEAPDHGRYIGEPHNPGMKAPAMSPTEFVHGLKPIQKAARRDLNIDLVGKITIKIAGSDFGAVSAHLEL